MAEPIISYPGAKWRFYQYMVDYFPTDMETFIEPFLGGGSVTLSVSDDKRFNNLSRMIAGDLSPEMWAFWNGVKQNPQAVREIAEDWFTRSCPHQKDFVSTGFDAADIRNFTEGSKKNWETNETITESDRLRIKNAIELFNVAIAEADNFWNWAETVDTSTMSLEQRAARIILVNKISFSGMGDSGSLSKDQFCDFRLDKLDKVYDTSKLLQRVEIYNVSFEDTMKYAHEKPDKTFIFLDPPYWKQEGSGLYGRHGDMHKGFPHEKFGEVTKSMPCKWFVTYDDSTFVRRMFSGKTDDNKDICIMPFRIPGGYTMAGKTAEDALAGEEVFIANYDLFTVNDIDTDDF